MREKIKDDDKLKHILEAIETIFEFTEGVTLENYKTNKLLRFAIVKNLEIIGEASYKLTKEFKNVHTEIDWQDMITMRHILVHGYYQVEDQIVWDTIQTDLQPLKEKIKKLIK